MHTSIYLTVREISKCTSFSKADERERGKKKKEREREGERQWDLVVVPPNPEVVLFVFCVVR